MKSNFNSLKFDSVNKDDKRKLFLIGSVFLFLLLSTIFWLVVPNFSSPQKAQGQSISLPVASVISADDSNKLKEYNYVDLNNFTGFTINQISNSQSSTSSSNAELIVQKEKSDILTIHKIKTRQILSLKIPIKPEVDKENLFLELQVNKELQIVASTMQFVQGDKVLNIPISSINTQTGTVSIIPNQLENGLGSLKKDAPAELILDIYIPDKTTEGVYGVDLITTQIDLANGKQLSNSIYKANLVVSKEDSSSTSPQVQSSESIQSLSSSESL